MSILQIKSPWAFGVSGCRGASLSGRQVRCGNVPGAVKAMGLRVFQVVSRQPVIDNYLRSIRSHQRPRASQGEADQRCRHLPPSPETMDMSGYKHRRSGLPAGLVVADGSGWPADFLLGAATSSGPRKPWAFGLSGSRVVGLSGP